MKVSVGLLLVNLNIYEMVLNWKFSPGGFGNGMANWVYGSLRGSPYLRPLLPASDQHIPRKMGS